MNWNKFPIFFWFMPISSHGMLFSALISIIRTLPLEEQREPQWRQCLLRRNCPVEKGTSSPVSIPVTKSKLLFAYLLPVIVCSNAIDELATWNRREHPALTDNELLRKDCLPNHADHTDVERFKLTSSNWSLLEWLKHSSVLDWNHCSLYRQNCKCVWFSLWTVW